MRTCREGACCWSTSAPRRFGCFFTTNPLGSARSHTVLLTMDTESRNKMEPTDEERKQHSDARERDPNRNLARPSQAS